MFVITPRGIIRQVERVFPVCEMRFQFNGQNIRLAEAVIDQSVKATGIMFEFETLEEDMMEDDKLFVGNLRPEKVKGIMQELISKGSYDLSVLRYQEWVEEPEETVFNEGQGLPYTSEFCDRGYTLEVNIRDGVFSHHKICKLHGAAQSTADECEEGADESDGVPGGELLQTGYLDAEIAKEDDNNGE